MSSTKQGVREKRTKENGKALARLAGFAVFLHYVPSPSQPQNSMITDGIVTFTGGTNRIKVAFHLLAHNKSGHLLISGVDRGVTLRDLLKREKMSGILQKTAITLGFQAIDTIGNAKEASLWIKKNNIQTVRLVTSSYHIPRSMVELYHAAPAITIVPHGVFESDHLSWWFHAKERTLIVREYHKIIAVLLRQLFEKITRQSL